MNKGMSGIKTKLDKISGALAASHEGLPSSDFDLNPSQPNFDPARLRNAAVLVPIINTTNGLQVIFTKRSYSMRNHPGQVSFPGGKQDLDDISLEFTALREAHEEIGLTPSDVTVMGALPKHETVTSFLVHPYVGLVPESFVPEILTDEVSEVFMAPLDHLTNAMNYKVEGRRWMGERRHYYTVPFGPYYIWGATARMLRMFSEILEQHDATS